MNIKEKLLVFALLLLPASVQGQLSMALQVPPSGVVQKSQLWNMVLVNGGSSTLDAEVTITVSSVADNNPVLTAISRSIPLTKGAHQLKYTDFSPVTYKFLSSVFNGDMRPEGFIPVGSYLVCYTVGNWRGDAYEVLTEDCINLEVQPLSPPILNLPFDGDTINTVYPQFSWLPPAPAILFTSLSYDIMVAEVLPGQSPLQAIQQNMPVHAAGNLNTVTSLYPASSKALDTSKWYAWAVVARNSNQVITQSDVWTFMVKTPAEAAVADADKQYLLLSREQYATGLTQITGKNIGIRYYSFDKAHEANIRFIASDGKVVQQVKQQIKYGDNTWWLALGNAFTANVPYTAEITDEQNHRYIATFSIQ